MHYCENTPHHQHCGERQEVRAGDDALLRSAAALCIGIESLPAVAYFHAQTLWIKAEADYARIHTREKSYLVSRTLRELEKRLDPAQFLRIHRSAMVRADKIRDVTGEGSSRYRVTLEDGTALIVSRMRAPQLKPWML